MPLGPAWDVRRLAQELGWPVIVAARSGLGTINHTLLTLEAGGQPKGTAIQSPIDGEVVSLDVVAGQVVMVGAHSWAPVGVVADLSQVTIVSDRPPPLVHPGARCEFRTPVEPQKLYVSQVSLIAPDGASLRCDVLNMDRALRVGWSGEVLVRSEQGLTDVALPRTSLVSGRDMVLVRHGEAPGGAPRYVETPASITFASASPPPWTKPHGPISMRDCPPSTAATSSPT